VSIVARAPYKFAARDVQANFAQPLLYFGWDAHMMFSAPLAVLLDLDTPFGHVVKDVLPPLYGEHPDFSRIDWSRVQWFRSATLFTPKPDHSLAQQGFQHKSVLRFRTPGLEGLKGSYG
jgi:phenol/toluene 2-monooxygenase (NADH) P4/A4